MPHTVGVPQKRLYCVRCGVFTRRGARISNAGLCGPCAEAAFTQAAREMAARKGPAWDAWVARMVAFIAKERAGS